MPIDITIETQQNATKKGRTFKGQLIARVIGDGIWPGGETDTEVERPVFAVIVASVGEAGPLVANLRAGRRAILGEHRGYSRRKAPGIEFLKSAQYEWRTQRHPEGVIIQAFLRELVQLDGGLVDPSGIRFVLLPPASAIVKPAENATTWSQEDGPTDDDRALIDGLAPWFAAWVDRRTRAPLVPDRRFQALLLTRCLGAGLASFSHDGRAYRTSWGRTASLGYVETDLDLVGLGPGLAMKATHEEFERVLGETVAEFYEPADEARAA